MKRGDFVGMVRQEFRVVHKVPALVEHHPAADAPDDGSLLVLGEIGAGARSEQIQDSAEHVSIDGFLNRPFGRANHIGMAGNLDQLFADQRGRQNEIRASGGDRGVGHAVVFRGILALSQRDPAAGLDGLQSERAIRTCPRQHYADGPVRLLLGQRLHEPVHGHVQPVILVAGLQEQRPSRVDKILAGRYHVHMVRFHRRGFGDFGHRHLAGARKQSDERTFVLRGKVLDEDDRDSALRGNARKKLGHSLQASRRSSDGNHRECPSGRDDELPFCVQGYAGVSASLSSVLQLAKSGLRRYQPRSTFDGLRFPRQRRPPAARTIRAGFWSQPSWPEHIPQRDFP